MARKPKRLTTVQQRDRMCSMLSHGQHTRDGGPDSPAAIPPRCARKSGAIRTLPVA